MLGPVRRYDVVAARAFNHVKGVLYKVSSKLRLNLFDLHTAHLSETLLEHLKLQFG